MHPTFLDFSGQGKSQKTERQLFSKNLTVPAPFSALLSPKSAMHPTDARRIHSGVGDCNDRRVHASSFFLIPRAKEKSKFQRSNFQIIPKFSAPFSALISHKNAMHPTDASDFNPGSMTATIGVYHASNFP